ncbi:MAG: DUF1648 domain-containing protein [Verrucomicrobiota bacterium]
MRNIFIISFIANLVLTVVVMFVGPETMAVHFGAGGEANGWASAKSNALIMTGVDVLLFASFFFVPQLMRVTPDRWVNLPNKDYWLKDENRSRAVMMLNEQMYKFGTLMFAFMFVVGLLVLQANLSDPVRLRGDLFWPPFVFIMLYSVYWTVRIYRIFRVPEEAMDK